ncbi:unnamed protein product [Dicrocoelium dendriticum]|nr:unnamed protein product [Dicrocoelium dendriticum]
MAADYSKSCNRSPNGVSAGDYRCSSDRISSQVSASFRSRLSSNGSSSTSYPSFGYRQATVEDRVQMASAKVSDSTLRLISPAKQTGKTVAHNRAETKPSLVASTTSFRSSATSLSSVLPPLLAPSSRAVTVINADIFHQAHHNQGSCDSAYASGINSSSSSSASSPAVGDLLSPMKPNCGAVNVAKSSPVRRKIQFVPIRPQSQQLYSSRTQPTRQRFLSATSGSCNLALNRSSFSDQQILVFEAPTHSGQVLDPTQVSELETHRVHRLVAPVYVRLGPDTNGSSEEVLLALPPGTTIIQTLGDVTQLTTSNSSGLQQQMTHRRILHTHATKPPTIADSQKIHTLRPAKSIHVSNKREEPYTPATSSADYSPTPYSSGSSPTSSWSPLSGDVFLPLSHMNVTVAEPEVKCKVEDFPSFYSAYSKVEDTTFQPESSDSTSEYSGLDAANQFEIDTGQSTMEFRQQGLEYLECNIHQTTMGNVGNSCAAWSSPPMGRESEEMRGTVGQNREFVKAACNPSMAPLAVDIIQSFPGAAQSEMRQSDIGPNTATDDTDFPMANEDNFDSSFDAMMRSIDITTFLPGTFAENEDSMDDYDTQNSESEPRNGSVESASQELVEAGHSAAMPHDRSYSTETAPLIDIDDMLTSLDHCPQLTHRKQRTTAVTYLTEQIPSYSRYANEPVLDGLKSVDMRHLINTGDGATGYSQHSPLSDLDSLDKSSLFVIKPDWSLRVCE